MRTPDFALLSDHIEPWFDVVDIDMADVARRIDRGHSFESAADAAIDAKNLRPHPLRPDKAGSILGTS